MSCGAPGEAEGVGDAEQTLMPRRRPVRKVDKGTCQRCTTNRSKYIVRSAPFCRACFEFNLYGRFTRELYPPLRPDDPFIKKPSQRNQYRPSRIDGNVLIALSGGAGSMAMLDLLNHGEFVGRGDGKRADLTKGEKEAIWDSGTVVYVDFSGVLEDGQGEDRTEWLKAVAEERGMGLLALKAEDVFDPSLQERISGGTSSRTPRKLRVDLSHTSLPIFASTSTDTPIESLRKLVSSLPASSRPALFAHILNSLLITAARCLPNITHLLLGETSTRRAQRIISDTALGKGWSLPLELASAQTVPESKIITVRPMRDMTIKDTAIWCWGKCLETRNHLVWRSLISDGGGSGRHRVNGGAGSIEGLTEMFIAGLSVTHPSTVSTITRTGDKLVYPGDESDDLCLFCQMPVDPSPATWKARTSLSHLEQKSQISNESHTGIKSDSTSPGLAEKLCYACLTTFTSPNHSKRLSSAAGEQPDLPYWITRKVAVDPESMRSDLAPYLLDPPP